MSNNLVFSIIFKQIPKLLSVILHPLIMPTLGIYILLSSAGTNAYMLDLQDKNFIITLVAAFTFVIPLAFVPFYYYFKISSTFTMNQRQDRIIPLIVTSIVFYICFMLFRVKGAPHLIQAFLFATTLSVFFNLLITIRWQISAHMIGIGGIIGLVFTLAFLYHIDTMGYLMLAILLAGLAGFARLSLNVHTPKQVYLGFLLGFSTTLLTIFLY